MGIEDFLPLLSVALFLYALWLLFGHLLYAVYSGDARWIFAMVWGISPVMLMVLAALGENQDVSRFLDLGAMPWSLVIGDVLPLPAALVVAGKASREWRMREWPLSRRWIWLCLVVGVSAGVGFHLADSANFRVLGVGYLATALTKIWHDLLVYPIFVAVVLAVGVPTVRYSRRYRWPFLGLLSVQVGLMACDAFRGLDPRKFHVACDAACGARHGLEHLYSFQEWMVQLLHHLSVI